MTPVVVDSSVVIKWFVAEVLTPEAIRLRDSGRPLHAPALLDVEVANIAWKKIGLVQNGPFLGNTPDRPRPRPNGKFRVSYSGPVGGIPG